MHNEDQTKVILITLLQKQGMTMQQSIFDGFCFRRLKMKCIQHS